MFLHARHRIQASDRAYQGMREAGERMYEAGEAARDATRDAAEKTT